MNRLKKAAVLTKLMDNLRERGNWCGETHVQKTTYLLQELFDAPLGFGFVLYWYGPFSFDLRDELTALRADEIIALEPQMPPYGPKIKPTDQAKYIQGLFPKTLEKYSAPIGFLSDRLGQRNVIELERLATALYATRKLGPDASREERIEELIRLKPHVARPDAGEAVYEIDRMGNDATNLQKQKK